jgi:hypothetical protein
MNNQNIINATSMIERVVGGITEKLEKTNKVVNLWNEIVKSIKSNSIKGENIGWKMAGHSKVIDLQNGILLVEADHPGWIQMLNNYKNYIVKGFSLKAPELKIQTIAFRLSGSTAELAKVKEEINLEKERKEHEERLKKIDEELEKQGYGYKSSGKNSKLPPEIQKLFDSAKNEMLTNGKKI